MGKLVAIAMLSKLSYRERILESQKWLFPLRQVQQIIFFGPRADGLRFPAHALDKILRTGNQLGFLTADQIVTALMKGISHLAGKAKSSRLYWWAKLAVIILPPLDWD